MLRWCERAAAAGLLWWLLAGCAPVERPDGRVTVRCGDQVQRLTVEQWRARPDCAML